MSFDNNNNKTTDKTLDNMAPEVLYNIFSFLSYPDVYGLRSVCRKFQVMGEFHIYQQIKSSGQTVTIMLDGSKSKSMELVASHYDAKNRVIEFRPATHCYLSLANTTSNHWSYYHRLMKIYFSEWFINKSLPATKIPFNKLNPQDQAMVLYHYQYNSSIEKAYELPSWNQSSEIETGEDNRYIGDKGLILCMSYQQPNYSNFLQENCAQIATQQPHITSLPSSRYMFQYAASSSRMPTAPSMDIRWIRVTLDWVLTGIKTSIPSSQIYEDSFAILNQKLAKQGCFKYDPLSEPVLDHIVHQQMDTSTEELPPSLVKYVHSHTHECYTRLSRLQHMLEGAGVDAQVLWKYTFAKSFVVGSGSLLGEEDVVRRIQDSEEEWRLKKLSLIRKLNTRIPI
jgi:hypothetical protein